jgi:hypothetical protein
MRRERTNRIDRASESEAHERLMDHQQLIHAILDGGVAHQLAAPRFDAVAEILAESIHLKLELRARRITVDGAATGRRIDEDERLQRLARTLTHDLVRTLMQERASERRAILAAQEYVLHSICADSARVLRHEEPVAPRDIAPLLPTDGVSRNPQMSGSTSARLSEAYQLRATIPFLTAATKCFMGL